MEDKANSDTSITDAPENEARGADQTSAQPSEAGGENTTPRPPARKSPRKFQAKRDGTAPQDPAPTLQSKAVEVGIETPTPEAPMAAQTQAPVAKDVSNDLPIDAGAKPNLQALRQGNPQNNPQNNRQNGPQGGPGNRPGPKGKGKAKRKPNPPAKVVEIAPMAASAGLRRRHWGLLVSALVLVVAPLILSAWYLWAVSTDQYASTVGFTVRQEAGSSSADLLGGGLGDLFGGSSTSDADILYEFIQSQEMVSRIDEKFDLRGHYSQPWPDDAIFAIWPDATIEELVWYWSRIIRVSYDQGSGLIELRVLAFDADTAQAIGTGIVDESQRMINALNEQAREDLLRYAQRDLEVSLKRLKDAREALILFRTRTQIVDPQTDLQGRLGVVNNLQAQLAQALIDLDVLLDQSSENDPRVKQARRTIEVIKNRIVIERENVASGDITIGGEDYPTLLAEFEGLVVDREFSEEGYRAALTALDVARNNAQRQSRYLEAYVRPTLPQSSEFPRRWVLLGMIGLFAGLVWSILALIYYSVRDSR